MAARRYWPATRAERERPMESLYRLRADIGFCEPRLRGLEKRGGRRLLLFRKVGGREPGFRTALCYSADSLTCASGFLEFLRPCTFAFALPSSRQTLSFPKSTINSFSFFLEFVDILTRCTRRSLPQDLYICKTSKWIVDPFITDQCRRCRVSWYKFFLI